MSGFWHFSVMPPWPPYVRCWGQSGKHMLPLSFSAFDRPEAAIREAIALSRQTAGVVRWRLEGGMKRREFLGILVGVGAGPLAARAQQPATMPTIGFMGAGTQSGWSRWTAAFVQRMAELGWVEGRTVGIDYRWAEGSGDRYAEIAAEFAQLKVSAIVTVGGEAAKQATSSIPIIAALSGDPVAQGLAASMARPGGNFTGMSLQSTDLAGKRLELLREVVPGIRRLAILEYVGFSAAVLEIRELQTAATTFGVETIKLPIRTADDIASVFDSLAKRAEALNVPSNPLANANRIRINELALAERLPTMHGFREYVEAGGLMSYGPNTPELFRRAAEFVDKILRGAKPGDLPIEQPTKFEFVINLKAAKSIGLAVSPTLLSRADEVIE
jgi:putative ABC transport system substrate-binding protein